MKIENPKKNKKKTKFFKFELIEEFKETKDKEMIGKQSKRTNREILTKGKSYSQKQAKKFGTDEVTFNPESRLDYLTGFHKRKLQRQKKAREFNQEQERLFRIEERKKMREEKKKQLDEQLKRFRETLDIQNEIDEEISKNKGKDDNKPIESDNESWNGFDDDQVTQEQAQTGSNNGDSDATKEDNDDEVKPILKGNPISKDVYDDETTVEIEALEPNDNFAYLAKLNNVNLDKSEDILNESIDRATKYAEFLGMEEKENKLKKQKKSKKKFRYLTKNERKVNQRKAYHNKHRH